MAVIHKVREKLQIRLWNRYGQITQ